MAVDGRGGASHLRGLAWIAAVDRCGAKSHVDWLITSVDDAVLVGVDNGLHAVAELELSENPCDVGLHRGLGQV